MTEKLEWCTMIDGRIDFDDLIGGANSQGMPDMKINSGRLSYHAPVHDGATCFSTSASGISLCCNLGKYKVMPHLGVRTVKILGC